ncbi:hypothetical protein Pfo_001651 [Paulownia fortunei]|nr:hypothetical protein Pfo_001651 [Paulownia fortunei]
MHWTRGETLGTGGFGIVSIAKTHQESGGTHHLPPVVAVKSAKVSESKSLSKEKELLDKFKTCPCILRCFGTMLPLKRANNCTISCWNTLLEDAWRIASAKGCRSTSEKQGKISSYRRCQARRFWCCKRCADEPQEEGDFRGTVLYAAPESITRQEYVPESDVWALGCTVLQMMTGKSPWVFDKKVEAKDVLFKIGCSNDIPEIPSSKKVSKEAKDFLKKCLVKDPTSRWKAEMLLDHRFVKMADLTAGNSSHHHRHHHLSSRLSHGIHSLVPHCFHVPKTAAVHAC